MRMGLRQIAKESGCLLVWDGEADATINIDELAEALIHDLDAGQGAANVGDFCVDRVRGDNVAGAS